MSAVRLDTDSHVVLTSADCRAVEQGADYTPTDLRLLDAGIHPYLIAGPVVYIRCTRCKRTGFDAANGPAACACGGFLALDA